ncbi:hypothetical protein NPIL_604791 [Nephila pilipes]|uniref:Uncharacterized protein n=1 Tax=Nephila pilipes TaxID=299642 RepID=A0A8X6I4Z4_NEPPI|nr:hypothetical protein NPIL_604791 [Nephila pilipes]
MTSALKNESKRNGAFHKSSGTKQSGTIGQLFLRKFSVIPHCQGNINCIPCTSPYLLFITWDKSGKIGSAVGFSFLFMLSQGDKRKSYLTSRGALFIIGVSRSTRGYGIYLCGRSKMG